MAIYPNDTVKSIMERRSIRKYKPQQITTKELDLILECGLNAPSAMNTQNWHFTVIQNQKLISEMNSRIVKNLPPSSVSRFKDRQGGKEDFSMFYDAPTLILVSGDAKDSYTDSNCGYAVQNMCLAAQSIGVASIIIGMARLMFTELDADKYAKELKVPVGYRPLYVVCFGYADMKSEPPERIPEKVSYIQ
jgi:nitroreductase